MEKMTFEQFVKNNPEKFKSGFMKKIVRIHTGKTLEQLLKEKNA